MACLLVASVLPAVQPQRAFSDDLSDAQSTLDQASERLSQLSSEYTELQAQADQLNEEVAQAATEAEQAQQAMLKGQQALGSSIVQGYKNDSQLSLVNVILSSTDIADFLKNVEYLYSIQQAQAKQIIELKELRDAYNQRVEELDARLDSQEELLAQAAAKREEAQQVVSDATAKVANIESERERAAALQAQADSMPDLSASQSPSQGDVPISSDWNTAPGGKDEDTSSGSSNQDSSGGSSGGSSDGGNSGSSGGSGSSGSSGGYGWRSGVASAYGGSTDPNTPNPGYTATGALCDDYSMGVAIPMSWSNYSSYFGRSIEIRYGGRTVIATVNDCGSMGGGSRSLDLQPGVFKALGFSSCYDWGLRDVEYRFL